MAVSSIPASPSKPDTPYNGKVTMNPIRLSLHGVNFRRYGGLRMRSCAIAIIAAGVFLFSFSGLQPMTGLSVSSALAGSADARASHAVLANGMEVVVIPDHRAPVVTHMVWYKVGAADEPAGYSGVAHFLEHLMFKGTDKIGLGEFSKIVARNGGQDNAFTSQDVTAYFQRVAKDRLRLVMEMEADRMVNLKLDEKSVLTERDVVLEERRSRVENDPSSILNEQVMASLYLSHPYGNPVIGWAHEIGALNQKDAVTFYKRFYAPNNAILIVSGDVTLAEVMALAKETYGKVARNEAVEQRNRTKEPPHRAARRVSLSDPRAGRATVQRQYLAPSYRTAQPGQAEALDLLMKIVGSGSTSRLYRRLVVGDKIAASAGGWYAGSGFDSGRIGLYGVASEGVKLDKVEAVIDEVLADVAANGVTEAELKRAKAAYVADYIYGNDNQASLARRYGWALAIGRTIKDVESWPDRIKAVTLEQVNAAAKTAFDLRSSVTATLLPEAPAKAAAQSTKAKKS
ncbi:MAG: M16 family metallopeptidase [Hyphomicrobiaceae bacterium]